MPPLPSALLPLIVLFSMVIVPKLPIPPLLETSKVSGDSDICQNSDSL